MKNRWFVLLLCLFTMIAGLYVSDAYAVLIELKPPSNYDTWRPINNDKLITDYEYQYRESGGNWNGWTSVGNTNEELPEFTLIL